jgi:hypothetical protein
MATNATFNQLQDRVNEANVKIKAAATENRAALQAQVEQAKSTAEQLAGQIPAQARGGAEAGWQSMKEKWQAHVEDLHNKAADKKAERGARKAQANAEAAEGYADAAISFAIAAVQEAEYAVLDAALARADADSTAS